MTAFRLADILTGDLSLKIRQSVFVEEAKWSSETEELVGDQVRSVDRCEDKGVVGSWEGCIDCYEASSIIALQSITLPTGFHSPFEWTLTASFVFTVLTPSSWHRGPIIRRSSTDFTIDDQKCNRHFHHRVDGSVQFAVGKWRIRSTQTNKWWFIWLIELENFEFRSLAVSVEMFSEQTMLNGSVSQPRF